MSNTNNTSDSERISSLEAWRDSMQLNAERFYSKDWPRVDDHEIRIRVLEAFKAKVAGYATVGAMVGGGMVNYLTRHLH